MKNNKSSDSKMRESSYIRFILLYQNLYAKGFKRTAKFLYWLNRMLFSCDIPCTVVIGKNLCLPHFGLGVVIHPKTVIGDNVKIYQYVTIGVRVPGVSCGVVIGNNVMLGAGCKILGGGQMKIGNNVKVGANSVVLCDVKDNATVVGIPAKNVAHSN